MERQGRRCKQLMDELKGLPDMPGVDNRRILK
jgi:hypothetical protein